jgi:hypothetical protein
MQTALFQYAKFGFGNDSVNGAATRWAGAKLVLVTEAPSFTPNPLSSEFVDATFDGYADATIAATTYDLHIGQDGQVSIRTPVQTFTCSADNMTPPVIGWALMNAAKDNVLAAALFDEPIPMNLENQQLIMTAVINIPTNMDQPAQPTFV